jgi:anti-sigma B factor antagonist
MNFTHEIKNGALVIRVAGDLLGLGDEAQLIDLLASEDYEDILLCAVDISGVNYMNSSGLTVLIRLLTKFRNKNGEVVLIHPSEPVRKLLVITKLNAIFQIFDQEAQALQFLQTLNVAAG